MAEKEPELPKVDFDFERDTANMKIWHIRSQWKPKSKYRLMIPAGTFRNVASQQNDTIKYDFNTLDLEKYGAVLVNVMGKRPDSRYVIYLRNEGGKVIDEVRHAHTGVYRFNYVQPGKVRVSVLEDNNDNGIWDTGNLIERRQPERTEPYVDERGEEIMEVKANWEIEVKADMNKLFAPITFESVNEQLRKTEAVRLKKILEEREKRRIEELKRQQEGEGGGLGGFTSSMGSMKSAVSSMGGMR